MRNRKKFAGALVLLLGLLLFIGGCDKEIVHQETEKPVERLTESEIQTEPETQTETELETNVVYTAQDKSVRITLPDSTWKVTQDVDEMRVFSGGTAMINIVHAADENQMKRNISSVARSQEELDRNLSNQYPGENAFKIESFENLSAGTLNTYEYVVSYNSTSMWAYAVTYGIIAKDQAYVVTGTVTDNNRPLLETVIKSVESFTVLNNPAFSELIQPLQTQTGVEQDMRPESEDQSGSQEQTDSPVTAEDELKSLTDYGTSMQLYAADVVNVRAEPSTESNENIIYSLYKGDAVTVIGETSQWFKVSINGAVGYISKAFLVSSPVGSGTGSSDASGNSSGASDNSNANDSDNTDNSAAPDDQGQPPEAGGTDDDTVQQAEYNSTVDYETSYTYYTTTDVNMRSGPSTSTDKVGGLSGGTAVTVIGETANWFIVSVNGSQAYISKSYVSATDPGYSSDSTGGDTSGNGSTGGDTSGGGSTGGDMSGGGSTGGDTSGGGSTGGDTSGGGSAGGDTSGGGSTGGDTSGGGSPDTTPGSVSGTITSAGVGVIVVAGDDGNTYTINTGDASISAADGIYTGQYVSVGIDTTLSDGSLHATSVTGY